jgi:hypothetical protein
MWDWQLPDLPGTFSQYGLLGLQQRIVAGQSDSIELAMGKELCNFGGLVRKVSTSRIQVVCMNDEAVIDTVMVDLSKVKIKK